MKVLCLCQKANSRSVVCAWLLRKTFGHEVLAAGMVTTSRRTRRMLYQWADRIVLVVPQYAHWIPAEFRSKLRIVDAGRDTWIKHDDVLLKRLRPQIAQMDVTGDSNGLVGRDPRAQ